MLTQSRISYNENTKQYTAPELSWTDYSMPMASAHCDYHHSSPNVINYVLPCRRNTKQVIQNPTPSLGTILYYNTLAGETDNLQAL